LFGSLNIDTLLIYLGQYKLYLLFLIVFLEYLNLPGLPAGIIMPAAGILIARGKVEFVPTILVSVLAGICGSLVLYFIGRYLGKPILDKIYDKYKKTRGTIDRVSDYLERYGNKSAFVTRLIPIARTLISIVAGTSRLNIGAFLIYSSFGILIWNFVFIYLGYAFGNLFLNR